MTNLFIADRTQTIKSTEEYPIHDGMIEKLDDMLNEYGVKHFFTLPIDSTDGIANNADDYLNLFYDGKDETTFTLVYILWCKTTRNFDDTLMNKAFSQIAKRAA